MAIVTHRAPPTHFHRRLVLLAGGALPIFAVLLVQLIRLTVVQGAELRREAEQVLDQRTYLPTYRGKIIDRDGRVLARDQASYDLALAYSVITGSWVMEQAESAARREVGGAWKELDEAERAAALEQHLPNFRAQRDDLLATVCRLGGINGHELEQRLNAIRRRVQRLAADVWENQRLAELKRLGIGPGELDFEPDPILEQVQGHVVLSDLPDEVAFEFMVIADAQPDMLEVRDSRRRITPFAEQVVSLDRASMPQPLRSEQPSVIHVTGVLDHVLGSVREDVWKEDVDRRPFRDPDTGAIDLGGYRRDDVVGNTGLERVFEDHLRGLRGMVHERRDTGERVRTAPVPGNDLRLTIDVLLQAHVQAILSNEFGLTRVQPWHRNGVLPEGYPLNSAAVVLEVETGEVLALVTMPTVAMGLQMTGKRRAFDMPTINRPVEAVYPPGSIIKPLVLVAAEAERQYVFGSTITCNGSYYDDRTRPRCWIFREAHNFQTHGPLAGEDAIARSCNIFFYTLADRLDAERLLDWYAFFGLGQAIDIGLSYRVRSADGTLIPAGQTAGHIPSLEDISSWRAKGSYEFNTLIMGIGQGELTWTPLHAANSYATLARGGDVRDATVVASDSRDDRPQHADSRRLDRRAVQSVLDGLRGSVEQSYGTSHHIRYDDGSIEPIFNADGVTVWAKTGTAQAPLVDLNQDGELDASERSNRLDHAWCVGLVGAEGSRQPMHAFAVIVEYGGSGGRVAGPVANQIVHVMQRLGYLPGGTP